MPTAFHVDYRAVNGLLKKFRKIQAELDPGGSYGPIASTLDDFSKIKYRLNMSLRELRQSVAHVESLRKTEAVRSSQRSPACIAATSRTEKQILQAMDGAKILAKVWRQNVRKKSQLHLSEKTLEERAKSVHLITEELNFLFERNCRLPLEGSQVSVLGNLTPNQQRLAGQFRRQVRILSDEKNGSIELLPYVRGQSEWDEELTENELRFVSEVTSEAREQSRMVHDIEDGVRELKHLSLDISKTLKYQKAVSNEIQEQMDKVDDRLDFSNKKLKTLLDNGGGAGLWCLRFACFLFLIALVLQLVDMIMADQTSDCDTSTSSDC